jgi:hypothetical protein
VMGYIAPSHKHEASNSNSYSSSSFENNYISQMEEGYSKYIKVKLRTPRAHAKIALYTKLYKLAIFQTSLRLLIKSISNNSTDYFSYSKYIFFI